MQEVMKVAAASLTALFSRTSSYRFLNDRPLPGIYYFYTSKAV